MGEFGLLTRRYVSILLGMPGQLTFLLIQVPIIGFIIVAALADDEGRLVNERMLYFVLSLAALWLGMMNACMEIAREADIYKRERVLGLGINAYLSSKLVVLALLGIVQTGVLVLIVHQVFGLRGSPLLHWAGLGLTSITATTVGLFISALAMSIEKAIALVPMVLMVHFLFSHFIVASLAPGKDAPVAEATITGGRQEQKADDPMERLRVVENLSIATWADDFALWVAGGPEQFEKPLSPLADAMALLVRRTATAEDDRASRRGKVEMSAERSEGLGMDAGVLLLFMLAHLWAARWALRRRDVIR